PRAVAADRSQRGREHAGGAIDADVLVRRVGAAGVAEAVVVGLPDELATVLLDAYVDRAAMGEEFVPGALYEDFFDGVPIAFEPVAKDHYPAFFGSAFLLYPDGDFPALQIIVPTPEGSWPWDSDAPEGFAQWQPVLTESGRPSF
ncbi:MAG: DUF4262 domain-containing protein, partial [Actinophytocola sp.]|nr:DUF4262 domain-containing protein [Actinophytocola sp.]